MQIEYMRVPSFIIYPQFEVHTSDFSIAVEPNTPWAVNMVIVLQEKKCHATVNCQIMLSQLELLPLLPFHLFVHAQAIEEHD